MSDAITRHWAPKTVVIASGGTTFDIDLRKFAGGIVILPSAITGTALAWHVSNDGTTFTALYSSGSSSAAVADTVAASRAYQIPAEAFAAGWVRGVMDSQGAARTIQLSLKG